MSYRLTKAADVDLLTILLAGIDRFGVAQAARYRAGLERSFELIGEHPHMARVRAGLTPPLRVLAHRSHVILYKVDGEGAAVIVWIRHAREDWMSDPVEG